MKPRPKQKRRLLEALGIIAVLALVYTVFAPRSVLVETAIVTRGTFRETIDSDGILRSKERYIVPAFADGDIKRVALKVGDPIQKGQPITQLFWSLEWEPVKAPISGVVSRVFRENAGPIRRGEPIIEIIDPDRLEIVAELLTTDAARLSIGNPARVEGWGDHGKFGARVVRVSKAGFIKQSALGVEEERTEVTMEPIDLPPALLSRLGSTFHVDVNIEVGETRGALIVPTGALFRDGDEWAVYRIVSGRARKARIQVAARGSQEIRIAAGLAPGDRVILFPGDLVEDGTRVHSRQD